MALQSTLGDLFSGIVLNFSRPYRPGDWISIDGGTDGRVIEINWRATHILTAKRDLAIVPNSTIAKAKITNVSSPSGIHGATITLQVGTHVAPGIVLAILKRALLNCRLVLAVPPPAVTVKAMSAVSIDFEISFFVAELGLSTQAQNELLDQVHRHLTSEGVPLAVPADQSQVASLDAPYVSRSRVEQLLDRMAIFNCLTPDERTDIAAKLTPLHFEEGDILYEPGTEVQSFHIIAMGVLSSRRDTDTAEAELLRLGPADHFGEIGLLTGTSPMVRIVALTPGTAHLLAKADLTALLQAHADVERALHRVQISRQNVIDPPAAAMPDHALPPRRLKGWLSDWLQHRYNIAVANN